MSIRFLAIVCCSLLTFTPVNLWGSQPHTISNDYGVQLLQQGKPEQALEHLLDAYRLYPLDQNVRKNLAYCYALLGERLLEKGKPEEAADRFDRAREIFPEEPKYHLLRGIALARSRQFDAAQVEMERARTLGGDTPEVLYQLGRVAYDTGQTAQALDYWEQALQLAPEHKELASLVAKVRRESKIEQGMDRGNAGHFLLSFNGKVSRDFADTVLQALEDDYLRVGREFGFFPEYRVPVLIYAQAEFREVTAGPDWSGAVYDGRIRLFTGGDTQVTPRLRNVLRHEYTHVVLGELTQGRLPVWLNEGLAEAQGRMELNPPLTEMPAAVREGRVPALATLEKSFAALSRRDALLAYETSYLAANFLVSRYGGHLVRELLNALRSGAPLVQAFDRVYASIGLDYATFQGEFLTYLVREFPRQ